MSDKPNILIVDDEEIVRRSCSRVLSGVRCETESAANGAEALRALEGKPFDVVLLDLRMPGDDGITVLRSIRKRWPESEVVVITGYPEIDTAKQAMRLGACDYLAKPLEPDQVIRAARRAVLHKRWALHLVPGAEEPRHTPTSADKPRLERRQEAGAGVRGTAC